MAIKTYYLLKRFIDTSEKTLPFYVEDATGIEVTSWGIRTQFSDATNVEYSTDNVTWSSTQPNIPANGRVYIRANATYWGKNANNSTIWLYSDHKVGGNIMSMLYGSNFTGAETSFPDPTQQGIFYRFVSSNNVVDAEKLALPATTLAPKCYDSLFTYSKITTAPILPATTLANGCYQQMFYNCTSLTAAPILPATTLANGCYQGMFKSCTSLTTAPALPATTLVQYCYNEMFQSCTALNTAPTLPATTLAQYCYYNMFNGCSNLNSITVGATSWSTSNAGSWLNNVSATGTFTKPTNTTIPTGNGGIPSGWTVVNV